MSEQPHRRYPLASYHPSDPPPEIIDAQAYLPAYRPVPSPRRPPAPPRRSRAKRFATAALLTGILCAAGFGLFHHLHPGPWRPWWPGQPRPWWQGSWVMPNGEDAPALNLDSQGQGVLVLPYEETYNLALTVNNLKPGNDSVLFSVAQPRHPLIPRLVVEHYLLQPDGDDAVRLYRLATPPQPPAGVLLPTNIEQFHTLVARLVRPEPSAAAATGDRPRRPDGREPTNARRSTPAGEGGREE